MFRSHFLLVLAWSGYCTLHSLLADKGMKLYIRNGMGAYFKYYRSFYNLFALALLAVLMFWQLNITTSRIWQSSYLTYILGVMMTIAGLTGMGIILKKYFITSNGFRDLFYEGGKPVLVTDGLHRFVRHPLYLGTFLFLWGLLLLIPIWSLLLVNMVITVYTLIGIRLEERKLISIFGERYVDYRKKVPMIWPFMRK